MLNLGKYWKFEVTFVEHCSSTFSYPGLSTHGHPRRLLTAKQNMPYHLTPIPLKVIYAVRK
jgi:hypothetical protein